MLVAEGGPPGPPSVVLADVGTACHNGDNGSNKEMRIV